MIVTINIPEPTITIKLENGRGNLELNRDEFITLHESLTTIYNEHYELLTRDEDEQF